MPRMPDPDITQIDGFDDTPTRVVCMDEYLSMLAALVVEVPHSAAVDVTEWDCEIPISIEGESAA
jgi:hypothetical protein